MCVFSQCHEGLEGFSWLARGEHIPYLVCPLESTSTNLLRAGLEAFENSALGVGLMLTDLWTGFRPASLRKLRFIFPTVQEGPFKIPVSNKQTVSPCTGQGEGISPRGQETGSSELLQLFVFMCYLSLQIWRMTQNPSSRFTDSGGANERITPLILTRELKWMKHFCKY